MSFAKGVYHAPRDRSPAWPGVVRALTRKPCTLVELCVSLERHEAVITRVLHSMRDAGLVTTTGRRWTGPGNGAGPSPAIWTFTP